MSKFESREDVLGKIEWEGGYDEALEYGIKTGDMPEGDTELEVAWGDMERAYWQYQHARAVVEDLLDESE